MSLKKHALATIVCALALHGCSADVETTDLRADPILGGLSASAGERGMVQIDSSPRTCGGVALRNDWVVTSMADDCVTADQLLSPTSIRVRVGTQVVSADAALLYDQGSLTALMLHLSSPLSLGGSTTGFRQDVGDSALNGAVLTCYGYGNNTATGGAGTLRKASFVAQQINPDSFDISTNAAGQAPAPGDGGSVCFDGSSVAGVSWGCFPSAAPWDRCTYRSGGEFKRWTLSVMETSGPRTNDTRAGALNIGWYGPWESTVWGTTVGATHDGPSVPCGCTYGPDVWYHFFSPPGGSVHYFDTAGSSYDTSLLITDASGNPVAGDSMNPNAGLCNDDVTCTTGGFTSTLQSRTAGFFPEGSYYVVVGGCGQGRFVLHHQIFDIHGLMSTDQAIAPVTAQLAGDGRWTSTNPGGTGRSSSSCGGYGAESARWFLSCGTAQQFFSLCRSDAGNYTRRSGGVNFDPVLRVRSARTYTEITCNDDGLTTGASDCIGLGGDAFQYGSRINNVVVPRGLNMVYVDERSGATTSSGTGMAFTLRYIVR